MHLFSFCHFKWIKRNICLPLPSKHAMYFCRYQTVFCINPHGIWWKLSEHVQNFWILTSKNIKAKLITDIQLQVRTCWSSFSYSHVLPIFWSLMPGNLALVMDIYSLDIVHWTVEMLSNYSFFKILIVIGFRELCSNWIRVLFGLFEILNGNPQWLHNGFIIRIGPLIQTGPI
jgi:hypothetical protein